MKKKLFKNYLIMIIGGMIVGIGVAFVVYGNLGGDAMTTFEHGINRSLNISLPIAQIIANAIFLVLLFFMDKKRVDIDTILCPLFITLGCQIATMIVPAVSNIILRFVYMIVGIIVVGIGIGIGAQTESGSNPYDGFVMALSDKTNKSYSLLRPVCDAFLLVIGIILKGAWGIGTIIATFSQGYVASVFIKLFKEKNKN